MHDKSTVPITAQNPLEPLVALFLRSLRGRAVVKRYRKIDGTARLENECQLVTFGDVAALLRRRHSMRQEQEPE